jgi:hypothetical protein
LNNEVLLLENILTFYTLYRRCKKMTKNAMSVAKGVAAVVATGVVVGYVSNKVMQKNPKTVKRKANDAVSAMGQIVNDISYLLK